MKLHKLQKAIEDIIILLGTNDVEVYTYADHGQDPEMCGQIGICYVLKENLNKDGTLPYSIQDIYYSTKQDVIDEGYKLKDCVTVVMVG